MALTTTRVHPSGVVTVDGARLENKEHLYKLVYVKPELAIKELYKECRSNPTAIDTFDFKQKVVKQCLYLYGDMARFFKYQLTVNRFIHGRNQEFLIDTLNFIKNGKRNVMFPIWEALMDDYPDMTHTKERITDSLDADLVEQLNVYENSHTLLAEWLRNERGLEDLLYTTYFLFSRTEKVVTGNK